MPTRNEQTKQWICDLCRKSYRLKRDASLCEKRDKALRSWALGEISDQEYADAVGVSVESVKLMAGGPVARRDMGSLGVFVAATQIYGNGRAQIPIQIRTSLGMKDGDNIFWFKGADGRYFIGADVSLDYQRGKMSTKM